MGNHGSDPASLEMMSLAGVREKSTSTTGATAQADVVCAVRAWR